MKRLICAVLMLSSVGAFALDNCLDFPVLKNGETLYRGSITSISSEESFGKCPSSVLVNGRFVAYHIQVVDYKGEQRCVYGTRSIAFMCRN